MMFHHTDFTEFLHLQREYALLRDEWERLKSYLYSRKYNRDQLRIPAGNSGGGQWTRVGQYGASRVILADAGGNIAPQTLTDADPEPLIPGARYAANIIIHPSAMTGTSSIDDSTRSLTEMLGNVMDVVEYVPGMSPQIYGIAVHTMFAATVRIQNFLGSGRWEVETTFGGAYYGHKGSIRTDVILRNDSGDIVAIYDVKTGGAKIDAARAAELRAKTQSSSSVPLIEMHVMRGVIGKSAVAMIVYRKYWPAFRQGAR